jgi:hypothetical protein
VVHRDLKHVPEVANHLNSQVNRKVHSIKAWLFSSAVACALGLTLAFAGYRGLLFSNMQHTYESDGVVRDGEPANIFDLHQGLLRNKLSARMITEAEFTVLAEEFGRRYDGRKVTIDDYRGEAFVEQADGGRRLFKMTGQWSSERAENRWLTFVGALLTFSGILGFIVEQRLRSVRV